MKEMIALKKTNKIPTDVSANKEVTAGGASVYDPAADGESTPLRGKALFIRILVIIAMVVLGANFGFSAMSTGLIYLPLKLLKLSTETAGIITFCVMTLAVSVGYGFIRRLKQYRAYAAAFFVPYMLFNLLTFVVKIL